MYFKTCTKPFLYHKIPAQSISQYHFVLSARTKYFPVATSYYKACTNSTSQYYSVLQSCTKDFPVPLRTTTLAQNTSQYYFVHASMPVLLRTTKLAQSTSQYYFLLQSLHKIVPSTTLYYKACTKYFPVLLRTTKLAQKTSRNCFVLQSLHKVLSSTTCTTCTKDFPALLRTCQYASTTLYHKACTKYFPVLLCTTNLHVSTHRVMQPMTQTMVAAAHITLPSKKTHTHTPPSKVLSSRRCSDPAVVKQRNIPYNDVYRGKHEHDANNIMMFCHPVRYPCAATNRMANFSPTDAWHQSYKTAPTCQVKTYPAQYI